VRLVVVGTVMAGGEGADRDEVLGAAGVRDGRHGRRGAPTKEALPRETSAPLRRPIP
jgi:hypothetical protein